MRNRFWPVLPLVLFAVLPASAFQVRVSRDEFVQKAAESYADELFVTTQRANLEGRFADDLFLIASERAELAGEFRNDLWAMAQRVQFSGTVADHARFAGQTVEIDGRISGNATVVATTVRLSERSEIDGSIRIIADEAILLGRIGGRTRVQARKVVLGGQFGGDVDLDVTEPVFQPGTRIAGNLFHTFEHDLALGAGVQLAGQQSRRTEAPEDTGNLGRWAMPSLLYVSLLVAGIPILLLWPHKVETAVQVLRVRWGWCAAAGSIASILLPLLAMLGLTSVVGIPLALFLLGVLMVSGLCGFVVMGLALGRMVFLRRAGGMVQRLLSLSTGLLIISFLTAVPVLMAWLFVPVAVFGLGAVFLTSILPAPAEGPATDGPVAPTGRDADPDRAA